MAPPELNVLIMKKRTGCLLASMVVPLWIGGWMLAFSLSEPRLPESDGNRIDLAGVYRLSGTTGYYRMGNPIVPVGMIAAGSDIVVRQAPEDELTVTSRWENGRTDIRSVRLGEGEYSWRHAELRYVSGEAFFGGILPGVGRQCRSTTVKRDAKGNLIVASRFQEKALMLFLIRFWESHQYSITLKPIDGEDQNPLLHRTQ